MSFSFEMTASKTDLIDRLKIEFAPQSVKDFVVASIEHFADNSVLYVKAYGHVYDGQSYNVSSAVIEVKPT